MSRRGHVSLDVEEGSNNNLLKNSNDNDSKKEEPKINFKRLMSLAKGEVRTMIAGIICLTVANVGFLAIPFYVGQIIDSVTGHAENAQQTLLKAVITLVALITVSSVFASIRAYLFNVAGERVVMRLRKQVFQSMITLETAFFDENKTGDLISRLASDCTVLQNTVTVNISISIRYVFTLFAGLAMLFYTSWKLTLASLGFIPVILLASFIYGKMIKKLGKQFQDALAASSDVASEAFSNVRTVKSFSKEEHEADHYADKIGNTFSLAKKRVFVNAIFTGVVTFFANVVIGVVLWYGGYLVITGELTPGSLTSFIIYTISVAAAVGVVTNLYGDLMNAVGASSRIFTLLDREPKVHWKGGIAPPVDVKGVLKLQDVHFSYPSRPDVQVLKGINLDLTPGKVVALVGPSGGGKSTIVSLLELFYYPTEGKITFDGIDLKKIDPQEYRKHIGLVSQEPALFGQSIAQNIAYGNPDVSIDRVIDVAKMANAHEFISKFPDGYDTMVGERGIKLSGGQKQRVAIARAFLTNPKILLLDEATSALDAESEYLVKSALDTLMKGRTTLVIAHRLSTVKNAHQVCVVSDGVISEQGTHEELIAANGLYKQLVQRQLLQQD